MVVVAGLTITITLIIIGGRTHVGVDGRRLVHNERTILQRRDLAEGRVRERLCNRAIASSGVKVGC